MAKSKNATPVKVVLAWLLAQKPWIIPVPGTTKLHELVEKTGATAVGLTTGELAAIGAAKIKVQGERYSGVSAKMIDR